MLIIIVGKTNSGKDGVAKYLKLAYGIPDLVSYATRPKRAYETDGVEHWFISLDRMKEIKETEDLLAWTVNDKTGIEYCSTIQAIPAETSTYILNPHGLHWGLKEGKLSKVPYITIYVECDEETILARGKARGDDMAVLTKRLESERDEFNAFRDNKEYEYIVYNTGTKEELLQKIDAICRELNLKKL